MAARRFCIASSCATVVIAALCSDQGLYAQIASFTWLPRLPGDQSTVSNALSGDGSTVVGASYKDPSSPTGVTRAFRWTRSGGFQLIGDLPGGNESSQALGVSADGSVIAGPSSSSLSFSHHPFYAESFVWSTTGGMQALGYLPGTNGRYGGALAVSGNGQWVVGTSTGDNGARPFRWSVATGMLDLGDLDSRNGNQDSAFAVNHDGSVIVGVSQFGFDRSAFRWTPSTGLQLLGTLLTPASGTREKYSAALDTNEDGTVVVGSAYSDDGGIEAFRWSPTTGMQGLGKLPGAALLISDANGVSADGSVIIGSAIDANRQTRAVLWNEAGQMRLLQEILISQGAGPAIGNGLLTSAADISADGRTIIGVGSGPGGSQSWIATLVPEPSCMIMMISGTIIGLRFRRRCASRLAPTARSRQVLIADCRQ